MEKDANPLTFQTSASFSPMGFAKATATILHPTLSQFFWTTHVGVRTTLLPLAPTRLPAHHNALDIPMTLVEILQKAFTST
jgi:hypothetical protein